MINLTAYVIEFDKDNRYKVIIDGVYRGFVSCNGEIDNDIVDFESALSSIVELFLSYDYDYKMVAEGRSKKGRPCRKYIISIDDGD